MRNNIILILFASFFIISCGNDNKIETDVIVENTNPPQPTINTPDFNCDSAYTFVKEQVDFGPRFPNNEAHGKCALYLKNKLKSYGLETSIQIGEATTFNNKKITIKNIIGEYNIEAKKRILLFAHWDSRPFADQDTKDMTKPILGANDGASGVGVLIEVARQLSINRPDIGVDIIFFDAEDYGQPAGMQQSASETFCLGSQYWGKNPHRKNYQAEYGILLDMVGSSDAYFTQEGYSMQYAPEIVQKVWNNANLLGFNNHFINKATNYITDDHQFVNELAGIPSIDIIHHDRTSGFFHPTWHTHNDNMDVINKSTLCAVGKVLLYTIYEEN